MPAQSIAGSRNVAYCASSQLSLALYRKRPSRRRKHARELVAMGKGQEDAERAEERGVGMLNADRTLA